MRSSLKVINAAAAMALALVASACSRPAPKPSAATAAPAPRSEYAPPLQPRTAAHGPGGVMILSGASLPDALVRLASPDGSAIGVAATHDGAWTLTAPVGDQPRLFSLSEDMSGRPLRAAGYIAALPGPAPAAVMLRPGVGAESLDPARGRLAITAIDFDSGGAAMISGHAVPGASVHATLDGAEAGEDRADKNGDFSISASPALRPGVHTLEALAGTEGARVTFDASFSHALTKPPFTATRQPAGWRIDWMTPGGGIQTTILFTSEESAQ